MSRVTTVMIWATGLDEDNNLEWYLPNEIATLNRLIAEDLHRTESLPTDGQSLNNISSPNDSWGGTKAPAILYGGAINYLNFNRFKEKVLAINWPDPDEVQVMVLEPEDVVFKIYSLKDLSSL